MADIKQATISAKQPQPMSTRRKVKWVTITEGGVRFESSQLGTRRTVVRTDPGILEMEFVPAGVAVHYQQPGDVIGEKIIPAANLRDVELVPEDA